MRGIQMLLCLVVVTIFSTLDWQMVSAGPDLPPPPIFAGPANPILLRKDDPAPTDAEPKAEAVKPAPLHPSTLAAPIPIVAARDTASSVGRSKTGVASTRPIVSVQVTGPSEINVGKTIPFTISVNNLGDSSARGVIVEATATAAARIIGTAPQAVDLGSGRIRFQLGDLPPRSKRRLLVQVVPETSGWTRLAASVQFSAATRISVAVTQPKLTIQRVGPHEVLYGEVLKHRVIVANIGDGPAENVTVTPAMPDGLKMVNAQKWSGSIGTLAPGQSRALEIATAVQTAGLLDVGFLARGDGLAEVSCREKIRVLRPLIQLTTKGPSLAYLNRAGVYAILIRNPGDAAAKNLCVTNQLSAGLRVTAVDKAATFNKKERILTWKIPSLAAGAEEVIRMRVEAASESPQQQRVAVRADNGLRAEAEHRTEVISRANLSLSVSETTGPVEVGRAAHFEITLHNRGTKDADRVLVKVVLPEGMYAEDSDRYTMEDGALVFAAVKVPAGEQRVLPFDAAGSVPGDQIVRVVMRSDWSSKEILAEQSVFFYSGQSPQIATRP